MISPIETFYNGYRFRSRLEARWAVFFDALGVRYEYEPEGFDLGDGDYYLPDFRVKCHGTRGDNHPVSFDLWIEVKGQMSENDARKINKFAGSYCEDQKDDWVENWVEIKNPILIVDRIPDDPVWIEDNMDGMDGTNIYPFNYQLIDGDYFGAYPAADKHGNFYLWGDDGNYINYEDMGRVVRAYNMAKQARFEHGEKPIILGGQTNESI